MNISELRKLDNTLITQEQLIEIEESENVTTMGVLGRSSQFIGATWISVLLVDDTDIDVFIKF